MYNQSMITEPNRWIKIARDLCMAHTYTKSLTSHHVALVVNGGNLISVGYNDLFNMSIRFDRLAAKLAGRTQNENHAEASSIMKALRHGPVKGMKMYVVRVRSNGELAMSRPCQYCMPTVFNAGIRRVIYSTNDGWCESVARHQVVL